MAPKRAIWLIGADAQKYETFLIQREPGNKRWTDEIAIRNIMLTNEQKNSLNGQKNSSNEQKIVQMNKKIV